MATAMKDSLPPKALHLVEIGHRNSERLIALVNDILDMEKLAVNRMAVRAQAGQPGGPGDAGGGGRRRPMPRNTRSRIWWKTAAPICR